MTHAFAFVFPGQGSQSVGMLDAWGDHPVIKATLAEASDALGQDLGALIHAGSKEDLGLTTNTQPVMLVAGVAAWRVWQAEGGAMPTCMAGHSLGEYSALVAAGSLTLAQAAPLVRLRAAAMQEAVPVGVGAMAAILGLPGDQVLAGCQQVQAQLDAQGQSTVVQAVNFNDPAQTVIAGHVAAVEAACVALKEMGAKRALMLPVSAPFHCSLMKPAADKLKLALADITLAAPAVPVINNVDVASVTTAEAIRDALYRQAFGPVRWVETIQAMRAQGIQTVVECGPGKVLTGMVRRIDAQMATSAIFDPASLTDSQAALNA